MEIKSFSIRTDGFVHCRSNFYIVNDTILVPTVLEFVPGLNKLEGEVDSGKWAFSYMISMYHVRKKDFVLYEKPIVTVNGEMADTKKLYKISCYLDLIYPLYSSRKSIRKQVEKGLARSGLCYSSDEIRDLFKIDRERFEKTPGCVGNERFKAMAAIGFANNKEVFCFPWLSDRRYKNFHGNISGLIETLENLGKVIILPVGKADE